MTTAVLDQRPADDLTRRRPAPAAGRHRSLEAGEGVVVHGDFGCPWSYLAYRRSAVLAGQVANVDWRAVEHAPWTPGVRDDRAERYAALADQVRLVDALLLPGEEPPVSPPGFALRSRATVAAYAEAYAAGVAGRALRTLFDSYWQHGTDVGDPVRLRALLRDDLRGGGSSSVVVREWGHAVDVTGGPVSNQAWRLVKRWDAEWRGTRHQVLPVVQVGDRPPLSGAQGVEWLGREVLARGLDPAPPEESGRAQPDALPSPSWISGFGGAWLERSQRVAAARR